MGGWGILNMRWMEELDEIRSVLLWGIVRAWMNSKSRRQGRVQSARCKSLWLRNINNYAWSRKYQGLYDYEAHEIEKRKYKVEGNAVILKDSERLILIDEKMDKISKGVTEVPHFKLSISKTPSFAWFATTTTISWCPSPTRKRKVSSKNQYGW